MQLLTGIEVDDRSVSAFIVNRIETVSGRDGAPTRALYQGVVHAGQTMTWNEKHPVSMVIGNPPGVHVSVNGKPEPMSTVNVVTLKINPLSKTPVTVG